MIVTPKIYDSPFVNRVFSDPKYFLESLVEIVDKDRKTVPFILNPIQSRYFRKRSHRDIILKPRQLGFCCHPNTRILTADLKWIPIKDIQIGQKVVASDEFPSGEFKTAKGKRKHHRKLRTAVVENKRIIFEVAYRLKTDDGRELVLTGEHRMLSRLRKGDKYGEGDGCGKYTLWRKAKDFKVGDDIRWVTKPWEESDGEDRWFGGLIDGEGYFRFINRSVDLSGAQNVGPLFDEMKSYVENKKYGYIVGYDKRVSGKSERARKNILGGIWFDKIDEVFKVIGKTRPKRFINKHWWEGKEFPGKRSGIGWAKTISIEKLPEQEMIDLQTSTHTYIAEGFVSHNSTLITGLFLHDTMFTPNTSSVIVAHTVDASMSLFEKVLFMFNSVPEVLRPHLKYRNRKELFFDRINSSFYVGSAETKDFGRGRTIINLHCLHPDVLILGENGFIKKISEIGVPTKEWNGDLISIEIFNNSKNPIIVTPDHNILTQNGWKRADMITLYDKIAQPKRKINNILKFLDFKIPVLKRHWYTKNVNLQDISKDYSVGMTLEEISKKYNIHCQTVKRYLKIVLEEIGTKIVGYKHIDLPLTEEFGWIVGIALAEAWIGNNNGQIAFTLNINEKNYANKIVSFFKKNFIKTNHRSNETTFIHHYLKFKDKAKRQVILICSKVWADFFREYFYLEPKKGKEKYIPDWVFDTNKEFCEGLIRGYLDGDGSNYKNKNRNDVEAYSVRPQITYQIRDLLCALGYGWSSVQKYENGINLCLRGKTFNKYANQKHREDLKKYKYDDSNSEYIFQNVKEIEKVYYKGPVYDLINQPDHRFRTVAGIVHNCSECSSPSWSRDFLDGLLESVPSSGVVIMESTARGEGGLYFDYYFDAKNGKNEYRNHYYRWFDHLEYHEPLPEGTIVEEFVESYDWDEQELVRKYKVSPYQIQWRRSKKRRLRMKFIQEYPELDDVDAFIKTGSSVFDTLWLDERDKELPEQAPAQIWLGGELFIYRIADPGAKYIIGVDTSEGDISSDFTAAMVIRIWPPPVEQVALLHGRWTPDIASEKVYKLARAYNYGLIVVERNNHGHAVLLNLGNGISRKGVNVYPPYANLYIGPDKKLGWLSTQLSKPQVIDELDRCMRAEELVVNSKQYIFEARRFVTIKSGYSNKYGYGVPESVGHDDICMAQAVALAGVGVGKFDFSFI